MPPTPSASDPYSSRGPPYMPTEMDRQRESVCASYAFGEWLQE